MTGSLEQARILISNDDGIDAEGIRILEQAARRLSGDVWVVAPAGEQSGKAHSFTAKGTLNALRRDEGILPLTVRRRIACCLPATYYSKTAGPILFFQA